MPNINYIASAGTGKTYNLVCKVIEKLLTENISLKELLILTFTEKTASQLKEKLYDKINEILSNEKVSKKDKIKLHKEIIYIDSGYIGTFHSVFLRILKKYPTYSRIDASFEILSEDIDSFLETCFGKWIEEDFEKNKHQWQEIIKLFEGKPKKVKNTFISLYKERIKINQLYVDLNKQKEKISILKSELENHLEKLFKHSYQIFNVVKEKYNSKFFKLSPFEVEYLLKEENFVNLPKEDRIFKRPKNLSEEEKTFYEDKIKPLEKDELFKDLEKKLSKTIEKLMLESLDYNANTILNKFFEFMEFVDKLKEDNKVIDFNDILIKTKNLLKNSQIKKQIKENFKYIFVDEFQDTDTLQIKILKEISNENIYIFGDPKQCIYTWRDANLEDYFSFLKEKNFKNIILNTNYRSDKILVNFFNSLISTKAFLKHIEEFGKEYKATIKAKKNYEKSQVKLVKLNIEEGKKEENIKKEAIYTANLIKSLLEDGYSYEEIMVLFRKNEHLKIFKEIFDNINLPTNSVSNANFLERKEINLILNILKLIEFPEDKISLLNVLKSPLCLVDDLFLYENKDNLSLENLNLPNLNILKQITKNKDNLTIEEIIDEIFLNTDLLESYALEKDGEKKVENLKKLKYIAKKKTLEGYSLRDFILFMESYNLKEFEEEQQGIKLLTMHRSKGLESKVVIIPLISYEPWQIDLNPIMIVDGFPTLFFPKNKVANKLVKEKENYLKKQIQNEQERLFYVAITRAKEKLIFISSSKKPRKTSYQNLLEKALKQSNFNIQIENVNFENTEIELNENDINEIDLKRLEEKFNQISKAEEEREIEYQKAITFQRFTSVSKIMKESHKEKEEVKINLRNENEENIGIYTGIVVHNVLEKIDFKNFSFDYAIKLLEDIKLLVPENIRQKVVNNAVDILKNFENSQLHNELKQANILFRELPFTLYENEQYIEGRIDLIYEKNGKIFIMDYKTNKYETEEDKKNILLTYEKQIHYYLKAVKKLFPNKEIKFNLGLLYKGEILPT